MITVENFQTSREDFLKNAQSVVDALLGKVGYAMVVVPCICMAHEVMEMLHSQLNKGYKSFISTFMQNPLDATAHDFNFLTSLRKQGYNVFLVPYDHHYRNDGCEDSMNVSDLAVDPPKTPMN